MCKYYSYKARENRILDLNILKRNISKVRNIYQEISIKQKKPPEVFCKKHCSHKFRKIHKKTPVPEFLV